MGSLLTASNTRFPGRPFTSKELDRSIPFDAQRKLRGNRGNRLLETILELTKGQEIRRRIRRPEDERSLAETASSLLANLIVAARNIIDPERFVAVSFNRNDYAEGNLSVAAIRTLRDGLVGAGLVEGQTGYHRASANANGAGHARRTRLRATPALLELFRQFDVDRREVGWRIERDVIVMKAADHDLVPEPSSVAASRAVLLEANARLLDASLSLPADAWDRVALRYRDEKAEDADLGNERAYAGDLTACYLYRSFKGGWDRGGRVYGGWWINLPKTERRHLTIDGEQVVELDYARLHPTMLFARSGIRLDFDPYSLPGVEGSSVRDLGKRTFNRLINRMPTKNGRRVPFLPSAQDRCDLPEGLSFQEYLSRFVERLAPVAAWFGTGVGLQLQREDSDLTVRVLQELGKSDIAVFPVHDSFIVRRDDREALYNAMRGVFAERYGFLPLVR